MENIMIVDVGCTFWTLEKIFQNAHQNKGFVVLPAKDIKPLWPNFLTVLNGLIDRKSVV